VLDTCEWLTDRGIDLTVLPVKPDGLIDLEDLERELDDRVLLVAVMLVNNEIGVIQPVTEIARMAHDAGALMLCDAVQGFGRIEIPEEADLVAISAHKIHGPKGIGALWMRDGAEPAPLLHGGGQERQMRSGTLSPALCVGFGEAAKLAQSRATRDYDHVQKLWTAALNALGPGWVINGDIRHRYHGNLNIRREGVDAARLGLRQRLGAAEPRAACVGLELSASSFVDPARLRPLHDPAGAGGRLSPHRRRRQAAGAPRRVTLVRFFRADGTLDKEVEAEPGQRLLDVAWAAREPLEGACEGVMACSTCHVIVDAEDFAKLPPASEEEEDLLDLASHPSRTSRLACQIILTADLETLNVRIPAGATNWMGR
jgi:cysteine desulfurase